MPPFPVIPSIPAIPPGLFIPAAILPGMPPFALVEQAHSSAVVVRATIRIVGEMLHWIIRIDKEAFILYVN